MVGLIGWFAESSQLKQNMARLLFFTHCVYTYLDFRASDSFLGTGLYKGPGSIFIACIGLFVTLLFLHLSFNKALYTKDTEEAAGKES